MSEPRTLKVVLPLPDRALHPNARVHWAVLAKAKKKARSDAQIAVNCTLAETERHETPITDGEIEVQATFYKRTRHVADGDGALSSLKAALDGIADQLGTNDSRFRHLPVKFELDRLNPRVEIVLTEVIEQLRNPEKPKRRRAKA